MPKEIKGLSISNVLPIAFAELLIIGTARYVFGDLLPEMGILRNYQERTN